MINADRRIIAVYNSEFPREDAVRETQGLNTIELIIDDLDGVFLQSDLRAEVEELITSYLKRFEKVFTCEQGFEGSYHATTIGESSRDQENCVFV